MSIALCFLTVGDLTQPESWRRFLAGTDQMSVYCHPKNPTAVQTDFLRLGIIGDLQPTEHGHVSLVQATLRLFANALRNPDHSHFVLLSETTVPLVDARIVETTLSQDFAQKSLIPWSVTQPGSEHFNRQFNMPKECRAEPFYVHDQWVILSRKHVDLLLAKPRIDCFQDMFAADEHYFMNVLVHALHVPLEEMVRERKTFVNWKDREVKRRMNPDGNSIRRTVHPKTYTTLQGSDLDHARSLGCWFFRKVATECDCSVLLSKLSAGQPDGGNAV